MTEAQKEKIVSLAKSLIGKPYKYGARAEEAPNFFDCSLFTQYIFKQIGIEIPRSTIEQAEFAGEFVENINAIETGDLIFFRGNRGHYNERFPGGIGHVVIYLGNNEIAHATSKRIQNQPQIIEEGGVKIEPLTDVLERLKPVVAIKRLG
jgi:cell wall-associated NlpC family hydrolase